jgi:DNA-binding LacI/PurR family transcriptional regulator
MKGDPVAKSAGPRRVTAADVARDVGISRAAVGFVLNNTPGQVISEGTRARVLEAAARLGYRPNLAATVLASGRSKIILMILPDWPAEFSMRLSLEEASRALNEAGYSLVTQTQTSTRVAIPLWESLSPDVVIGWGSFGTEDVKSMRAAGVTRILPRPGEQVAIDEAPGVREGVMLQVDHLRELGHRRIAYAGAADPRMADLVHARVAAAEEETTSRGIELVAVEAIDPMGGSVDQVVRDWRAAGITAVVAFNDDVAAAVTGAAVRAGIGVPEELAVIGHDDSPVASLFVPSLSSVRLDAVRVGRFLADWALQEVEDRPALVTAYEPDPQLVIRESTMGSTATHAL